MKSYKLILAILAAGTLFYGSCSSAEVLNPNYGTTTFFSDKGEAPSSSPPIYGAVASKHKSGDKKSDNSSDDEGSLFGQIIGGIGSFFSDSNVPSDSDGSLFDLQKNSDQGSGYASSDESFMGARGESLDDMSDAEVTEYNDRFSKKFNFGDSDANAAPKKSKLLFTNIIVPVDMTTQYVLVALVFLIAFGGAVGYYFWKKSEAEDKKLSEEKYD